MTKSGVRASFYVRIDRDFLELFSPQQLAEMLENQSALRLRAEAVTISPRSVGSHVPCRNKAMGRLVCDVDLAVDGVWAWEVERKVPPLLVWPMSCPDWLCWAGSIKA